MVYELDVYPTAMTRYTVLTDAVSGKVVKYYQKHCLLAHADKEHKHETPLNSVPPQGAEVTTAKDLMDVTRSLNVWRDNSTVYLIDGSRPMFKPGSFKLDNPIGAIWTLDAKSTNPNNLKVDQIKSTTNTWAKMQFLLITMQGLLLNIIPIPMREIQSMESEDLLFQLLMLMMKVAEG